MSFGENLKNARNNKKLSQESFAEILQVSRQAVSRWESDQGYPEVEMLLKIQKVLDISLDRLFDISRPSSLKTNTSGEITIHSPNENVIVRCSNIASSQQYSSKKQPQYALFAITGHTLGGEKRTFLGWYSNYEAINTEIKAILHAISSGNDIYTLQYAVKTIRKGVSILIDE